ncbi:MAG: phosphoenolpyruvate--protein phosphotransferase [Ottowia sp.]|nr:phosphoenolpyruvate--protein phosphotransferase [Ottowia sp.]
MAEQIDASFTLTGIPISRGIALGRAHLIAHTALEVRHYLIEPSAVEVEVNRLCTATEEVHTELLTLRDTLPEDAPEEMAAFLDVHLMILHDEMLTKIPAQLIRKQRYNAEWALTTQLEILSRQFDEINDAYLRERKADVVQIVERVLKRLAGAAHALAAPTSTTKDDLIVIARDIAPADMLQFKHHALIGFATDLGGETSHTAIVARSLDIPAVVGLQHACQFIKQNDWLIIDGDIGVVIVNPSQLILNEYRDKKNQQQQAHKKLQRLRHTPTQTEDGIPITLLANIEIPDDAPHALSAGAMGVGLFRSEFLFMNRGEHLPDEEEQFLAYRNAVNAMGGLPATIRTIDLGADKPLYADHIASPNAALGLRAIRWALSEPHMFLIQLRALLRASACGPVQILLPMLAHHAEVEQTLLLLARAKSELDIAGHAYDANIKVGAMIEIPAAVFVLPMLMQRLDFLSIGTNDLIQYTLAVDRTDSAVAHLYDPHHPAVLQLIARVISEANRVGMPVAVCGEMAGDPNMTRLLLGMGLQEFSMHPAQFLHVKKEILQANQAQLSKLVHNILISTDPHTTRILLAQLNSSS